MRFCASFTAISFIINLKSVKVKYKPQKSRKGGDLPNNMIVFALFLREIRLAGGRLERVYLSYGNIWEVLL